MVQQWAAAHHIDLVRQFAEAMTRPTLKGRELVALYPGPPGFLQFAPGKRAAHFSRSPALLFAVNAFLWSLSFAVAMVRSAQNRQQCGSLCSTGPYVRPHWVLYNGFRAAFPSFPDRPGAARWTAAHTAPPHSANTGQKDLGGADRLITISSQTSGPE
jgi:hypothetical protein